MEIDFRNIGGGSDKNGEEVMLARDRWRGFPKDQNVFVLYDGERASGVGLFIEPTARDFSAWEVGGRFMEEHIAKVILVGGNIRKDSICTHEFIVHIEFINPDHEKFPVARLAKLLAIGFEHEGMSDFYNAKITYKNEPFLDCSTIAQLIRRYS